MTSLVRANDETALGCSTHLIEALQPQSHEKGPDRLLGVI